MLPQRYLKIYSNLSDWQIVQIARHPKRPRFSEIAKIFSMFQELHGDRTYGDDTAIIGGTAYLEKNPVMIIGQEKGCTAKEKIYHNFGMMHPSGYKKALRLMKIAEKFSIPIITFIDTPGAFPGIKAEEHGQSIAIANNLYEMSKITVPIICVIIGEGCSGGALGIGVGDKIIMLEYSYFSTISPEGCAAILWKTRKKAPCAAEAMSITAKKLKELQIIDDIIEEPLGGAHNNVAETIRSIKNNIIESLKKLINIEKEELLKKRYKKLMSFGKYKTDVSI